MKPTLSSGLSFRLGVNGSAFPWAPLLGGVCAAVALLTFDLLWLFVLGVSVCLWLSLPCAVASSNGDEHVKSRGQYRLNGRVLRGNSNPRLSWAQSTTASQNAQKWNGCNDSVDVPSSGSSFQMGDASFNHCTFPIQSNGGGRRTTTQPTLSPLPVMSEIKTRLHFSPSGFGQSVDTFGASYISPYSAKKDWCYADSGLIPRRTPLGGSAAMRRPAAPRSPGPEKDFSRLQSPSVWVSPLMSAERQAGSRDAEMRTEPVSSGCCANEVMKAIRSSCKRKRLVLTDEVSEKKRRLGSADTSPNQSILDESSRRMYPRHVSRRRTPLNENRQQSPPECCDATTETDHQTEERAVLSRKKAFGLRQEDTDLLIEQDDQRPTKRPSYHLDAVAEKAIGTVQSDHSTQAESKPASRRIIINSPAAAVQASSKQDATSKRKIREVFPGHFRSNLGANCVEKRRKLPFVYASTIDVESIQNSMDEYGSKGLSSEARAADREDAALNANRLLQETADENPTSTVSAAGLNSTAPVTAAASVSVVASVSASTLFTSFGHVPPPQPASLPPLTIGCSSAVASSSSAVNAVSFALTTAVPSAPAPAATTILPLVVTSAAIVSTSGFTALRSDGVAPGFRLPNSVTAPSNLMGATATTSFHRPAASSSFSGALPSGLFSSVVTSSSVNQPVAANPVSSAPSVSLAWSTGSALGGGFGSLTAPSSLSSIPGFQSATSQSQMAQLPSMSSSLFGGPSAASNHVSSTRPSAPVGGFAFPLPATSAPVVTTSAPSFQFTPGALASGTTTGLFGSSVPSILKTSVSATPTINFGNLSQASSTAAAPATASGFGFASSLGNASSALPASVSAATGFQLNSRPASNLFGGISTQPSATTAFLPAAASQPAAAVNFFSPATQPASLFTANPAPSALGASGNTATPFTTPAFSFGQGPSAGAAFGSGAGVVPSAQTTLFGSSLASTATGGFNFNAAASGGGGFAATVGGQQMNQLPSFGSAAPVAMASAFNIGSGDTARPVARSRRRLKR